MTDTVASAEFRAALTSIDFNASNYQVFGVAVAMTFLFGLTILVGTLVAMLVQDQDMPQEAFYAMMIADGVVCVALLLAYFAYLRNIGKYVYGRIKPVNITT